MGQTTVSGGTAREQAEEVGQWKQRVVELEADMDIWKQQCARLQAVRASNRAECVAWMGWVVSSLCAERCVRPREACAPRTSASPTGADPIIRDFDYKRLTYTFSAVTVTNAA